jgi:hypothetical protein
MQSVTYERIGYFVVIDQYTRRIIGFGIRPVLLMAVPNV